MGCGASSAKLRQVIGGTTPSKAEQIRADRAPEVEQKRNVHESERKSNESLAKTNALLEVRYSFYTKNKSEKLSTSITDNSAQYIC